MPEQDFERGRVAGDVARQLEQHEERLRAINGSIAKSAEAMCDVALRLQGITDRLDAAAVTRVATADALEKADSARRAADERSWSPFQKTIAIIGVVVLISGALAAAWRMVHP